MGTQFDFQANDPSRRGNFSPEEDGLAIKALSSEDSLERRSAREALLNKINREVVKMINANPTDNPLILEKILKDLGIQFKWAKVVVDGEIIQGESIQVIDHAVLNLTSKERIILTLGILGGATYDDVLPFLDNITSY